MDKIKIKEALVVEGKYDKNTLSQIVDAPIFVTNGFGIFKDPETLALLRTVAEKRGLIVLTDADGGGLVIRNHLKGAIDPALVKHAYIPDVPGKEKRKSSPGREGKLGVEGMEPAVLLAALRNAGATFLDEATGNGQQATDVGTALCRPPVPNTAAGADKTSPACRGGGPASRPVEGCRPQPVPASPITKADLYEMGLSGKPDSKEKRQALQKRLGLPENLSANALLTALNCLYTKESFLKEFYEVLLYNVIPLYRSEMDYKLANGAEALLEKMPEEVKNGSLNIRRPPVV